MVLFHWLHLVVLYNFTKRTLSACKIAKVSCIRLYLFFQLPVFTTVPFLLHSSLWLFFSALILGGDGFFFFLFLTLSSSIFFYIVCIICWHSKPTQKLFHMKWNSKQEHNKSNASKGKVFIFSNTKPMDHLPINTKRFIFSYYSNFPIPTTAFEKNTENRKKKSIELKTYDLKCEMSWS